MIYICTINKPQQWISSFYKEKHIQCDGLHLADNNNDLKHLEDNDQEK